MPLQFLFQNPFPSSNSGVLILDKCHLEDPQVHSPTVVSSVLAGKSCGVTVLSLCQRSAPRGPGAEGSSQAMERTCWLRGYVSQLTNGFALFLQKKFLLLLSYPSWVLTVRQQNQAVCSNILLVLTNIVHCKAWILPESQQRCREQREEPAGKWLQGMARKVGCWLVIHVVLLCASKGTEMHYYNRAPPGMYLFTLKHCYTN